MYLNRITAVSSGSPSATVRNFPVELIFLRVDCSRSRWLDASGGLEMEQELGQCAWSVDRGLKGAALPFLVNCSNYFTYEANLFGKNIH